MNRYNLPLTWHAVTEMSAIGWVMIAYNTTCLISPLWLASIAEDGSIINATLLNPCTAGVSGWISKGLLHGYEWGLRFGGLELRFG